MLSWGKEIHDPCIESFLITMEFFFSFVSIPFLGLECLELLGMKKFCGPAKKYFLPILYLVQP